MKEHIVSTYDDDLNTLKTKLLEMGVLVERQIFQAIEITKIIKRTVFEIFFTEVLAISLSKI